MTACHPSLSVPSWSRRSPRALCDADFAVSPSRCRSGPLDQGRDELIHSSLWSSEGRAAPMLRMRNGPPREGPAFRLWGPLQLAGSRVCSRAPQSRKDRSVSAARRFIRSLRNSLPLSAPGRWRKAVGRGVSCLGARLGQKRPCLRAGPRVQVTGAQPRAVSGCSLLTGVQ